MNSVGLSVRSTPSVSRSIRQCVASINSRAAGSSPPPRMATTVSTAASTVGNDASTALINVGTGTSFNVASVITPSVPSLPTNRCSKSYPDDCLTERDPTSISRPSANATCILNTLSLLAPYFTVRMPAALFASIPPTVAFAPGSGAKNSP